MATPLGSGLGAFLMGEGTLGHDTEDEPSTVVKQTPVSAIAFDPYNRIYSQNTDLTMVASSAPIQRAAHLMLPLGSIASVPFSGIDVVRISRAAPTQRRRVIEDELRSAWKTLLETRQIVLGKITLDPSVPWSGRWDVEVTDLVTEETTRLANLPQSSG